MSKYQDLSKEELLKKLQEFEKELKNKKYGLVWESEKFPEQVVLECENNLPVLEEVNNKEIKTPNCEEDYNILIEGDNYHALTVLNYTHENKIDVIYIDPPYNTGNKDFIYNDHYVDKEDSYRHSKWLNFMEKRLKLAKNLLKEDGVIFISIDDNEQAQLKLLCDKIFGEENFVANLAIENNPKGRKNSNFISVSNEYCLIYSKDVNKSYFIENIPKSSKDLALDDEGNYIHNSGKRVLVGENKFNNFVDDQDSDKHYTIYYNSIKKDFIIKKETNINEIDIKLINSGYDRYFSYYQNKFVLNTYTKNKIKELFNLGALDFKNGKIYEKNFSTQIRLKSLVVNKSYEAIINNEKIFFEIDVKTTSAGTELKNIFGTDKIPFNNPKNIGLLKLIITLFSNKNLTILDFFAGSGTTGHAVLDLNKQDGGNRKFILCTNNQNNICEEVTYKRLEKVMNGYNKNGDGEFINGLGGNLKYFKTSLIKKSKSRSQLKIDITQKCTEMLCLKESIFDETVKSENYKIFTSTKNDKHLAIYYNFLGDDFDDFIEELKKLNTEIIVYVFSVDNNIDKSLFKGLDVKLEAIPQKILEVYRSLAKMNISANSETIFTDFEKAYKRVFEEKDKDDGAFKLRIVIEKILQKLCQLNGIDVINTKGKDEKASLLNDTLKNKQIIDQVTWQQNSLYLTIGNKAAHSEYDEYDLDQVQDFYKHVQNLIDKFNI